MRDYDGEKSKTDILRWCAWVVVPLLVALIGVLPKIIEVMSSSSGTGGGITSTVAFATNPTIPSQAIPTERVATLTPALPIKITYPPNGAKVKIEEIIQGTWQNIPEGSVIWIVVHPRTVDRYHPQNKPADREVSGQWMSRTIVGLEGNVNEEFDIFAVLADRSAQDAFVAYLSEAKGKADYPGLERLPASVVISDHITVIRQ
jgi:hypothetical protein